MLWPPHHLFKWKFCSQADMESNKRNLHLTGSIGKTKRTWYKMERRGFSTFRLSILGQFSNNWNIPICWTIQNNFNHSTQRYLLLCPVASCLLEAVAQVFPPKPPSEHNNWTIFPSILALPPCREFKGHRTVGRWCEVSFTIAEPPPEGEKTWCKLQLNSRSYCLCYHLFCDVAPRRGGNWMRKRL